MRDPKPSNDFRAGIASATGGFLEDSKVRLHGPAKFHSKGVWVQGYGKPQLSDCLLGLSISGCYGMGGEGSEVLRPAPASSNTEQEVPNKRMDIWTRTGSR